MPQALNIESNRATEQSVEARKVPTRRLALEDTFDSVPRHFAADGDIVTSHFIAALTALFPDGEDYFVRSVRRYRDQVNDPVLKRQVAGFIGQEAVHGREHRAFNERLDALGYHTRMFERATKRLLAFREAATPAITNLALTAALEHFTATIAELLLTSEETRDQMGDRSVQDLFVWHALEESEHKAVAFDVYRAVGGSERMRILTMKFIRKGFVVAVVTQMLITLATDRAAWNPVALIRSFRRFRRTPIMQKAVWEALREYDRPGFHPNDRDTEDLVETWRERLFGESGTLKDKLANAAA